MQSLRSFTADQETNLKLLLLNDDIQSDSGEHSMCSEGGTPVVERAQLEQQTSQDRNVGSLTVREDQAFQVKVLSKYSSAS